MKIEYVSTNKMGLGKAGRKPLYPWAEFFEELYKDDSMELWGMFPMTLKSPGAAYSAAKRYKDIKVSCKQLDNGEWIVYGQYQPGLSDRINDDDVF